MGEGAHPAMTVAWRWEKPLVVELVVMPGGVRERGAGATVAPCSQHVDLRNTWGVLLRND